MRHRLLPGLIASVVALASLGAQAPRLRDSARVQIVENGARARAPVAFVATRVLLDVGGVHDNPDDDLMPNNGDLHALRLPDGGFAVADGNRIRYLDARGRQTQVDGRRGEGPGEYQTITGMCLTRGDTLLVGDARNARITVYEKPGGKIARQIPVRDAGLLAWNHCFSDGTLVTSSIAGRTSDGLTRVLNHLRPDGTAIGKIGPLWTYASSSYTTIQATILVSDRHIVYADPRTNEIRILGQDGAVQRIIRTDDEVQDLTSAETSSVRPIVTSNNGRGATPKPESWPAFGAVEVDEGGRIWVEDYRKPKAPPGGTWTAFDPTGRLIGRVQILPIGTSKYVRVRAFHRDAVQVEYQDDDGAVHLRWYGLDVKR